MLDQLLARAQAAGEVRADVSAMDVLMLLKGVCEAAAAFQHLDPQIVERQLDLVRAALSPPTTAADAARPPPHPRRSPGRVRARRSVAECGPRPQTA